MSLRVIFMGTPEFAAPTLSEIVGQGHEVVACYTRPPAAGGRRGLDLTPSPVHRLAEAFGIPVHTPKSLRTAEALDLFTSHGADVAVVVAYGMILPRPILDTPALGCLNLHGSLLPRWRGAAPIQRAVMAGDAETGVMVMRMEEGLDTGPVAMVEKLTIGPDMTAADVHDRLMLLGADLMVRALAALSRGALTFTPQAETGVTYAAKIRKEEAAIDWQARAAIVHNLIRGLSPFPGAYFIHDRGTGPERIKVLRARRRGDAAGPAGLVLDDALTIACAEGAVQLLEVQRAGKAPMPAAEFLRGTPLLQGARLRPASSDAPLQADDPV